MFRGKRVLIAGSEGVSGRAATRLALMLGGRVAVADRKRTTELEADCEDLRDLPEEQWLLRFQPDVIITAPGVPLALPLFAEARARGIAVFGENDLGYRVLQATLRPSPFYVAVTGTDGKSTTVALIAHLCAALLGVTARACGNFGEPLSAIAAEHLQGIKVAQVLIVELSSFQLELVGEFRASVSMILNVAPDHLDRYAGMTEYARAKLNIARNLLSGDLFLHTESANLLRKFPEEFSRMIQNNVICEEISSTSPQEEIIFNNAALRGKHNRMNIHFALRTVESLAIRMGKQIRARDFPSALEQFKGLPHRLENCGEVDGLLFINDSKATTIQAVLCALETFNGEVHLLLGGRNKGLDFSALRGRARMYPYGEAGPTIAAQVEASQSYEGLEAAFRAAVVAARSPAIVLLSPGCTSFDEFRSYADRGETFRRLVRSYAEHTL
ncbi:MAG: UDP-N-acetylmuramoyl-L-alanine--D-glutamate ligase [Spirochaetales bacterium]|nr:UDP-N-acetylmuramoyl-L-alanine--D-glutamate ligase [Spirochaetales bacterium]